MVEGTLDVGEILHRTASIARLSFAGVLAYIVVLSGASIAVDLANSDSGGSDFVLSLLSMVAGYFLIRALVSNAGLVNDGGNGFGSYFGLSILTGLGLLLGFVCLVVPGIVLLTRWQPAFAILLAEEDATVTGALSKSWDMTGAHFWPILAATLIGVVMWAVALLAYVSFDLGYAVLSDVSIVAGNIMLSCASVYSSALGVAVYALLRTEARLDKVFA